MTPPIRPPLTPPAMVQCAQQVAQAFQVPAAALVGRTRTRQLAAARQCWYLVLVTRYDMSSARLAPILRRHPSTLTHGVRVARRWAATSAYGQARDRVVEEGRHAS